MSKDYSRLIKKLISLDSKKVDEYFHSLNKQEFEKINCLECANCCKNLGPLLTDSDITRLSKHLKIKPSEFVEQYLRIDEDNDYVFKTMPCPFLQDDNYCSVYEFRPKACKGYPHTDRKNILGILDICIKNTEICPAVANIFNKLNNDKFLMKT
ncbi:MAG TPA: YkgJ family cysteine cluster protein [Bacteroidales bacterium]|mgnify:FL=1|nr:YkgJ family cysteine cluster protein [Bacteroidales bacterium]HQB21277.1 YkgJ family cysteine cluster protein [Bacteroidales bacterium]